MNKTRDRLIVFSQTRCLRFTLGWVLVLSSCMLQAAERGETQRIDALLGQARQALAENRLTIPSGHNAVGYAQQVLDLVPGHPRAQEILREVVAHYSALGDSAVDRAKALRERELEKARGYQERGLRIAQNYKLSDSSLKRLKDRLAAEQSRDAMQVAGGQLSGREALSGVMARYISLSRAALRDGDVAAAQQYRQLAQDLVSTYSLPDAGLQQLDAKLAEAPKASQAPGTVTSRAPNEVMTVSSVKSKNGQAVFLPPSF